MIRPPSLEDLRADHQEALLACHEIRENAGHIRGDGAQGAWAALTERARGYLQKGLEHHLKEEERLLGVLVRRIGPGNPLVGRALADHRGIRGWVREGSLPSLLLLADGLENHIRFEETVLFPFMEEALGDGALDHLKAAQLEP
jgi:hemerythrin-like domain-containing protein